MKITRRHIQIVVGMLWVLDGCLQFQPKMFTSAFITQVIDPAKVGQPFWLTSPIHFASSIFLTHPAVFDSLIAIIQIGIGLLILFKKSTRWGLWSSVLWGLVVWYFGEALSGLAIGQSSLLMGLPGSALMYVILSLAIMPKENDKQASDSWLVFAWSALWLVGAIYQLMPSQASVGSLRSMISMSALGAPGWLANIDNSVFGWLGHFSSSTMSMSGMKMAGGSSGYWLVLLLAALMIFIGIGVLINKKTRTVAIILGILLSALFWIVGQGLGAYYSGFMTDPSTAPLIVLMGLAVIGQPELSVRLKRAYGRVEKALVS